MYFRTESSIYQVKDNKIRRLVGIKDPTERQGQDGNWQDFIDMSAPEVGRPVLVQWGWNPDGTAKCTMTSRVKEVLDDLLS